jgi:hypothetical protein
MLTTLAPVRPPALNFVAAVAVVVAAAAVEAASLSAAVAGGTHCDAAASSVTFCPRFKPFSASSLK